MLEGKLPNYFLSEMQYYLIFLVSGWRIDQLGHGQKQERWFGNYCKDLGKS